VSSPPKSAVLTSALPTISFTARPLLIGTGGLTSRTLRPQWVASPSLSAAFATSRRRA
jgi:hypothetical protein